MIFRRALVREFTSAALTVFLTLLAIVTTILIVRFLGEAASGSINGRAVLALLGFSLVGYLPVLLSLTVFIAVLMTLTRWYRDGEMVVWFTSGQSLAAWVRPVSFFAAPVVLTIALLSLVLTPWALDKSSQYRRQLDSRDDAATITPGMFKESKQADRVYFVENLATDQKSVGNVFMQSVQHQRLGVVVAQEGYQETLGNGDKFLVLLNGRRYEGLPGSAEFRIVEFARYAVRIEPYEAKQGAVSSKSLPTLALIQQHTPAYLGELLWRLGLPVSAFILALLAIPLSFVNPRAGRSMNLIFAVLIYMVYSNLISIVQAWVVQGKISFATGIWSVHLFMVAVLLVLFYRRLSLRRSVGKRLGLS